jgi:hypothetical protein
MYVGLMRDDSAITVDQYLGGHSPEKRAVLEEVLAELRRSMPGGYQEGVAYGMIWYSIPLSRFSETYNGMPLGYVALAAQKNYFSLHMMACYEGTPGSKRLRKIFEEAGKKLDMGKACVRFRKVDDLPLPAIGDLIADLSPDQFIQQYEAARAGLKPRGAVRE